MSAWITLFRAIIGILCLAVIAVAGWQPNYAEYLFTSGEELRALHPDTLAGPPEFPLFLEEVRRSTPRGSSIGLMLPLERTRDVPPPLARRAKYLLAGRTVNHLPSPETAATDFVASWKQESPPPGYQQLWARHGGTLAKRVR